MESHGCYLKGKVSKVRIVEMARDPKKIHFQIICGKFGVIELDPTTYFLEKLKGYNLNGEENIESLKTKKKSKVHTGNVEQNCGYAHKLTTKTPPIWSLTLYTN